MDQTLSQAPKIQQETWDNPWSHEIYKLTRKKNILKLFVIYLSFMYFVCVMYFLFLNEENKLATK